MSPGDASDADARFHPSYPQKVKRKKQKEKSSVGYFYLLPFTFYLSRGLSQKAAPQRRSPLLHRRACTLPGSLLADSTGTPLLHRRSGSIAQPAERRNRPLV